MQDCFTKKNYKRKNSKSICHCNKENDKFINPTNKTYLKLKNTLNIKKAQSVALQLKKSLAAINIEMLALSVMTDIQEIKACRVSKLHSMFEDDRCFTDSPLNAHIKNDPKLSIPNLIKSFQDEYKSSGKAYLSNFDGLVTRSRLPKTCNLSDRIVTELYFKAHMIKANNYISNFDSKEGLQTRSIIEAFDNISKDALTIEESRSFQRLNRNPIFSNILARPEYTKLLLENKPLSMALKHPEIKRKLKQQLGQKCSSTFKKAFESLCLHKEDEAKDEFPKYIKSVRRSNKKFEGSEKIFQDSQAIHLYCSKSNDESFNLTSHNEDMNKVLRLSALDQQLSPNHFITKTYINSQHDVREKICKLIPEQGNLLKSWNDCQQDEVQKATDACQYLDAYKTMLEEQNPELKAAIIANKEAKEDPTGTKTAKEIDPKLYNWLPIAPKLNKPSALMSNFLEIDTEKEKGEEPVVTVVSKTENNSNESGSNNSGSASSTSDNSNKKTNFNSGQTNNQIDNSINSRQTASTSTSSPSQISANDMNQNFLNNKDKYASSSVYNDEGLKNKIKKMFKKKKRKDSKQDQALYNQASDLVDRTAETVDKMMNSQSSDYISSNQAGNAFDPDIDEEFLDDEILQQEKIDSFTAHNPYSKREPTSRSSRSKALPPGFMRRFDGEVLALPVMEIGTAENRGMEGVISGEEGVPEISLYGSLAQNLSSIEEDEVITYDLSKGKAIDKFKELLSGEKPFVINNQGNTQQRVLVKIIDGQFELVPMGDNSREFKRFFKSIKKAFDKGLIENLTNH